MPKVKSMTPGAIAARERRNVDWETKRFNVTLRQYMMIKHDKIFDEYSSFYESLAAKYPNKRNLTRTSAFKIWKKSAIEQSFREDGVLAEVTDLMEPNDQESEESSSEFASDGDQFGISQVESTPDILSVAMNEILPDTEIENADNEILPDIEIENADNLIAEIINELEQEGPLQEILVGNEEVQNGDVDEGIALDYQTELEAVVESFDYELEIDF